MLYAICDDLSCGFSHDQEYLIKNNFKIGDKFEVEDINMGQSYTSVFLKGYPYCFNSVNFRFEDENGNDIDIFNDPRYNPYFYL